MQVKDQFTEFGQDSWVSEQKQKGKARGSAGGPDQTQGVECVEYYVYQVCDQYGNCTIVAVLGCATYVYTNDEPGGGGGGNGDDSESCGECSPTQPCQNTGGVPEGCPVIAVEVDPCETDGEHPTLESPTFQHIMYEAAEESGFGESEDNRLESWYVIKQQNGDYTKELIPYSERTSCSYTISTTDSFFDGVVALVHTHPYAQGDMVNNQACLEARGEDSPMQYTFEGPSQFDVDLANQLSLDLYTMDYDNIHFTDKNDTMTGQADKIERCGY